MDWVAIIGGLVIAYLLWQIWRAIQEARAPPPAPSKWMVGDITPHTLQLHSGMDYSKPTLIAVQGVLYDVTSSDVYGPRECSLRCCQGAQLAVWHMLFAAAALPPAPACSLHVLHRCFSPSILQVASMRCMLARSVPVPWPRTPWT